MSDNLSLSRALKEGRLPEFVAQQEAAGLSPADKLRHYQRLIEVADELNLWQAGVGPKPKGVIVCKPHGRRSR